MNLIVLVDRQIQEWPRSIGIGYLRGILKAHDIKSSVWDLTAFYETASPPPPPQNRKEMLQRLLIEWIPLSDNPPFAPRPKWNFDILSVKELAIFRQAWLNHCNLYSHGKIQKYLKQGTLELIPELTIDDLNIHPTDQENLVEETLKVIDELYHPFKKIPYIGFSLLSNVLNLSILSCLLKELNTDLQVIFGGPFPSYSGFSDLYLRYKVTDYCVRHEGEETLLELLQGKKLSDIADLSYRNNDKIYHNPARPPMELKDLPLPIYDGYQEHRLKIMPVNTNRGCPFHCRFCSGHCVHRTFRKFPIERILQEINYLLEKYPVEIIHFVDSAVNNDLAFVKQFLKEYNRQILPKLENPLKLAAPTNLKLFDKEFVELAQKAGFYMFYFGIESTVPQIQRKYVGTKQYDLEEIRQKLMLCQGRNIAIYCSFIVGFPGVSEEEINLEFKQIKELIPLIDVVNINAFCLEPDTFIANHEKKFNIRKESSESFFLKFYTPPIKITSNIDLNYPFLPNLGYTDFQNPNQHTRTIIEKITYITQQWEKAGLGTRVSDDDFVTAASKDKKLTVLPPEDFTSASG
ncbi:MAG: B12-binding domain-containing radical SAM protein [Candidatus Hodarchaeota archaeon]